MATCVECELDDGGYVVNAYSDSAGIWDRLAARKHAGSDALGGVDAFDKGSLYVTNNSVVVLLSHNGFDVDRKLASRVDGIDVILTGHTHDALPEPVIVNDTLVIASGATCTSVHVGARIDVHALQDTEPGGVAEISPTEMSQKSSHEVQKAEAFVSRWSRCAFSGHVVQAASSDVAPVIPGMGSVPPGHGIRAVSMSAVVMAVSGW